MEHKEYILNSKNDLKKVPTSLRLVKKLSLNCSMEQLYTPVLMIAPTQPL